MSQRSATHSRERVRLHNIRLSILSLLCALLPCLDARAVQSTNEARPVGLKDVRQLELKLPVRRQLRGGETHSYSVSLILNQYVLLVVDQQGIDVVVSVFDPEGSKVVKIDRPSGSRGPEAVYL